MFRTERDPLGELDVPADAYYGIQTARAIENFHISDLRAPDDLVVATVLIKRAAAEANEALGRLEKRVASAILQACDTSMLGAANATENGTALLHAVPDHATAALSAGRRQGVDRALERIKDVLVTVQRHGKRFVVIVTTHVACGHRLPSKAVVKLSAPPLSFSHYIDQQVPCRVANKSLSIPWVGSTSGGSLANRVTRMSRRIEI